MDRTQVEEALARVIDPELGVDIVELGMVTGIEMDGGDVVVDIALTIASCPLRSDIERDVRRRVEQLPGVETVTVRVSAMDAEARAALMSRARLRARETAPPTAIAPPTRVLAVASGKGGVGKSSVAANLAVAIGEAGHRVGLLDADIWGFSIPRLLGILDVRLEAGEDRKIVPAEVMGMQVVSTGLIVEDEGTALMWRGLMLSKALEQLLRDVAWDPSLDYLFIDMPPGTGDVHMALSRLLPQAEMLVVTTPQQAAQRVASRVADMARRSHMPVLGVVENMAGFVTEDGRRLDIFGTGGGRSLAEDLGVPLLGSVPLDPAVAEGGDEGRPVVVDAPESPAALALRAIAGEVVRLVPAPAMESCTARLALVEEQLERIVSDTARRPVGTD